MRFKECPSCKRSLKTTATACVLCGWQDEKRETAARSGDGTTRSIWRCEWMRAGMVATCQIIVAVSVTRPREPFCQWHQEWVRLETVGDRRLEQQAYEATMFRRFLEQFRPSGPYGWSPGHWWASDAILWAVVHGERKMPIATREIRDELRARHYEAWCVKHGHAVPPRRRMPYPELPPWNAEAIAADDPAVGAR